MIYPEYGRHTYMTEDEVKSGCMPTGTMPLDSKRQMEEMTFEALLEDNPKNLIHLYGQVLLGHKT